MAKGRTGSGKRSKPSVEYNLEKEPLKTGIVVPSSDLRERISAGGGQWGARRRMAGLLAVLLMLIIVALGIVVAFDLSDFWTALFGE